MPRTKTTARIKSHKAARPSHSKILSEMQVNGTRYIVDVRCHIYKQQTTQDWQRIEHNNAPPKVQRAQSQARRLHAIAKPTRSQIMSNAGAKAGAMAGRAAGTKAGAEIAKKKVTRYKRKVQAELET